MVLRPALPLPEEGPLLLKVGFADGLSPTHATLALVPAAREVDAQVRVIRHPRSVAALESRLEEVLARCEAGSFTRLVLSGVLQGGVTWQLLDIPSSRGDVEVLGQELYLTRARANDEDGIEKRPGPQPGTVHTNRWARLTAVKRFVFKEPPRPKE